MLLFLVLERLKIALCFEIRACTVKHLCVIQKPLVTNSLLVHLNKKNSIGQTRFILVDLLIPNSCPQWAFRQQKLQEEDSLESACHFLSGVRLAKENWSGSTNCGPHTCTYFSIPIPPWGERRREANPHFSPFFSLLVTRDSHA